MDPIIRFFKKLKETKSVMKIFVRDIKKKQGKISTIQVMIPI